MANPGLDGKPSIENPVYANAVQGAQEVFLNAGYQMLLVCTNYNPEIETRAIRTLIAKQVDGILLTVADAQNSEGLNLIRSRQLPHSLLFNEAPAGQVSWSVGDHAAAAAVERRAEADVLRRERHLERRVRRDAHAVARRLGAGEGPACVKIMIRCRPGQIFDAGSPQQPQLLWSRMSLMSLAHLGHCLALSKDSGMSLISSRATNSTTSPRSLAAATFNLLSPR